MKTGKHNIFSESHCLNREQLLLYHQGKLDSETVHMVERHLVDCPLCADALEGIMLSGGTTIPDFKKEIDSLTGAEKVTPFRTYLAAAATVTVVVFTGWFVWDLLKNDIPDERMAIHEVDEVQAKPQSEPNEKIAAEEILEAPAQKQTSESFKTAKPVIQQNTDMAVSGIAEEAEESKIPEMDIPVVAEAGMNDESENARAGVAKNMQSEITSVNTDAEVRAQPYLSNVTYVDNTKVIDYSKKRIKKKSADPGSVPSSYQNRKEMTEAEEDVLYNGGVAKDKVYLEEIADPIVLFNKKRYSSAIEGFDRILEKNSNDENARFYKGMSLYHLEKYDPAISYLYAVAQLNTNPFSEEAYFYTAKAYLMKGDKETALTMFRKIIKDKGFYADKAREEIEMIRE